jgi:hypothetical protein
MSKEQNTEHGQQKTLRREQEHRKQETGTERADKRIRSRRRAQPGEN